MKENSGLFIFFLFFLAPFTASIGFSKHYFPDNEVLNQTINIFAIYVIFLIFVFLLHLITYFFDVDIETNKFMILFDNIISYALYYLIIYGILLAGFDATIILIK